jgi:hypothetical protein
LWCLCRARFSSLSNASLEAFAANQTIKTQPVGRVTNREFLNLTTPTWTECFARVWRVTNCVKDLGQRTSHLRGVRSKRVWKR